MKLSPKVGDKLWCVMSNRNGRYETTVTKIGLKWIYFNNGHLRCDFAGKIDGGKHSSPGTCYLSKGAYEAELALTAAWNKFRLNVRDVWDTPKGITIEKIQLATDLLFKKV